MSPPPNHRLVAARAAARLTQEALADLANAQVERDTATPGAMDADYISKLERGVHTWPGKDYRRALRTVLGASSDAELGFYSKRSRAATVVGDSSEAVPGSDDVKRQAFLRAVAATVAGMTAAEPAAEAVARAAEGDTPARVGTTELRQVEHAIDVFGQWQDLYGGGMCEDAIAGQVRWALALLGARCSGTVRTELHSSVGFLVDIAGWGAFDAGHHDTARRYFRVALHCAEQADDWGLRANILSDMARQAIYLGRADDGLSLIELAQVRQDRLTATARAMLSTVQARALSGLTRGEDCYRAVRTAEDHFSDHDPNENPPWITYFDAADLAGDAGHALFGVALAGSHVEHARDRLRQSVASYAPTQARARAFSLGKLAILELTAGDPARGVHYGQRALDAEAPLRSRRAKDDLVGVRRALERHSSLPEAAELRTRLTHALRST